MYQKKLSNNVKKFMVPFRWLLVLHLIPIYRTIYHSCRGNKTSSIRTSKSHKEHSQRKQGMYLPYIHIIINPLQILFVPMNPPSTSNFKHTSRKTNHWMCSRWCRLMFGEWKAVLLLLRIYCSYWLGKHRWPRTPNTIVRNESQTNEKAIISRIRYCWAFTIS